MELLLLLTLISLQATLKQVLIFLELVVHSQVRFTIELDMLLLTVLRRKSLEIQE